MHIIAKKNRLAVLAFGIVALALILQAPRAASAFAVPERLEYSIWWGIIKAGNSVLEIKQNGDDEMQIVSTTKSSKFLSMFYKVNDRIEVNMEKGTFLPYDYYINLREGKRRKEKKVNFERDQGKIVIDHIDDKNTEEFDVEGNVYDPLSAFYLVRTMDVEVGKSQYIRVFDNGKLYDVEVQVLRKEKLKLPHGTYDTIVIKPVLKSEGIFMRKGDVLIWVTDDENKVPVKVESKVKVGKIHVEISGGDY